MSGRWVTTTNGCPIEADFNSTGGDGPALGVNQNTGNAFFWTGLKGAFLGASVPAVDADGGNAFTSPIGLVDLDGGDLGLIDLNGGDSNG